jgi:prevent-host-death family protein
MHITNISDAKANLSRLLREVQRGKRVIIGRAGEPIAVLSAYSPDTSPRKLGGNWEGKIRVSDDFDDTPPSVVEAFYDSELIPDDPEET